MAAAVLCCSMQPSHAPRAAAPQTVRRFSALAASTHNAQHTTHKHTKPDGNNERMQMPEASTAVASLQLAPHGVVRAIYPLAGNERALGLDLLRGEED